MEPPVTADSLPRIPNTNDALGFANRLQLPRVEDALLFAYDSLFIRGHVRILAWRLDDIKNVPTTFGVAAPVARTHGVACRDR
jgi:hypothetical protein